MPIIQPLPTQLRKDGKQYAEGYLTPKTVATEQHVSFSRGPVIPVIFLPGIMGSALRMNAERQTHLRKKNNKAWHPDSAGECLALGRKSAREGSSNSIRRPPWSTSTTRRATPPATRKKAPISAMAASSPSRPHKRH